MVRDRTFPPKVLRWSELRMMGLSAARFRAAYEEPKEQSPSMRGGTLVHTLILGGDDFAVFEGERRGKAWEAEKAKHPADKLIVTAKELAKAERIAAAVQAHPLAAPLLVGDRERELAWDRCGRACAGRIDVLGEDFIVDLKTTALAEPEKFKREALRRAYHAQLAHYFDGAVAAGFPVKRAYIVAVETEPPFDVVVFPVSPRALEEGRKMVRLWIEKVIVCEAAGEWPGYTQSPVELDVVEEAGLIFEDEEAA